MLKTILVPLDGSRLAASALEVAGEMAAGLGAEVILVCVMGSEVERHFSEFAASEHLDVEEAVRSYLEGRARTLEEEHGVEARVEGLPADGSASEAVLVFAEAEDVDLVVMSTRGRSGLARMVLGSVTQEVLRKATAPVVVVRPPDQDR